MARILSSLSAASKASIISFCIAALKAFSLSGRFSVMVRICSATSYLIVSYAMGLGFLWFIVLYRPVQLHRHARACPGRPRLSFCRSKQCVDGRVKPGHDDFGGLLLRW